MKREYLINAGNRISDYHEQGKNFATYLDETIKELQLVVETAQAEITKFTALRDAVTFSSNNGDNLLQRMKEAADDADGAEAELQAKLAAELSIDDEDEIGEVDNRPQ